MNRTNQIIELYRHLLGKQRVVAVLQQQMQGRTQQRRNIEKLGM